MKNTFEKMYHKYGGFKCHSRGILYVYDFSFIAGCQLIISNVRNSGYLVNMHDNGSNPAIPNFSCSKSLRSWAVDNCHIAREIYGQDNAIFPKRSMSLYRTTPLVID